MLPDAAASVRVLSLAVLLVGAFAVPSAQLARDFRQDRLFLATVVSAVPANLTLLVLASAGQGALAFAWSRVLGQLLMGLVVTASAPRRYRPGLSWEVLPHLLRFGLPLAGADLVNHAVLNADYAVVGRALGPAELGTYVLAFNVASWSTSFLGALINSLTMPAFSRVRGDAVAFSAALSAGVSTVLLLALPLAAVTSALARPLVLVLYGDQWAARQSPCRCWRRTGRCPSSACSWPTSSPACRARGCSCWSRSCGWWDSCPPWCWG